MNWKMWAPLALAVVLGLVAAKVARDVLTRSQTQKVAPTNVTSVVVVKQSIRAGSELHEEDLGVSSIASEAAPAGTFKSANELVGRVAVTPLVPGQAVVESFLAPRGSGRGLQAVIPAGMRAVTFEINETSGVAGHLVPGCHVDVVTTLQNGEDTISRTIVSNLEITACGGPPAPPGDGSAQPPAPHSVTLLASPKDAEAIELATSTSRPRLVLRGGLDGGAGDTEGVTLAELRGKTRGGGIKGDPFATYPIEMTTPTTRPTTQESGVQPRVQGPTRSTYERTVKIIRGGAESNVVFEVPLPKPGAGLMTDTNKERAE